jgi:hypothetical protein
VGGKYGFSSSWQTSTDPSVAWTNWQAFNAPSQGVGNLFFAAVQICDGLTQMWLNPGDGALQTIRKTSTDPNSAWMAWEPFSPGPGPVNDVVVATLKNGDCQIFVMTQPAANGSVQILTSRQDRSGDHRHKPMQPWTDWASIGTLS